jgi:prepilin-type N-terminal cleavage/methylation domain-containing protein
MFLRSLLQKSKSISGFTLIELIAVVTIAGILSAIAAASFEALQNTRRINAAQGEIFNAIKEAQSRAKKEKISYQVSIRRNPTGSGEIQIGVHNAKFPSGPNAGQYRGDVDNWNWRPIVSDLKDSQRVVVGATGGSITSIGPQRVICIRFDSKGILDLGGNCISLNDRYIVVKGERSTGANQKLRCIRTTSALGGITSLKQGEASCKDPGPANFL